MKKMMAVMMLVVVSLVGCGKSDGKKAANEINTLSAEGNTYAKAGLEQYNDVKYYANDIDSMSKSELVALSGKLTKAKSNLNTAKAKYQQALNVEAQNNDSVSFEGKATVQEIIKNIDIIVGDIDAKLSKIEARMKKKSA